MADDGFAGEVEGVKDTAFLKDGGFGAVNVLGRAVVRCQDPSAEGHHPALDIADREHQAVAKAIIGGAAGARLFGGFDESGGNHLFR